jgi:hypothetical protein
MRWISTLSLVLWLAWAPAASLSQTMSDATALVPAGHSLERDYGTVIRASKWPSFTISVCWENLSPAQQHFADVTRQAVQDTWEHYSKVRFNGWGACQAADKGIRIRVSDELPHTMAIGKYLDAYPSGMVLNFTFQDWGAGCQARADFCAYAISAHEFGHALGFTHEQQTANSRPMCDNEPSDFQGDYLVVKYDPNSIMNLCNPQWNGNGQLSALDIAAVARFYS